MTGAQAKADAAETAAKEHAGTLAYGTNLEATDATTAAWVEDPGSATGAALRARLTAKARVSDAGLFVAPDGSDTNDGLSPGAPRLGLAAAVGALPANGGTVTVLGGQHELTAPIAPRTGLRLVGMGRTVSRVRADNGLPMFEWDSNVSDVVIEGLYLRGGGLADHLFKPGPNGGLYLSTIHDCVIDQANPARSIWHSFIDVLVDHSDLYRAADSTVPGWYVRNSAGALNSNRFTNLRVNSRNSTAAPFFHLESATSGAFAHDNRFVGITGEQNLGGLIHAYSVLGLVIEDVVDWDASGPYAADLVRVGRSAVTGAPLSRGIRIRNMGRRGGTLSDPYFDVNCIPTETILVLLENVNPSSGTARLNYPASATLIGVAGLPQAVVQGQSRVSSPAAGPAVSVGSTNAAGEALLHLQPEVAGYAGRLARARDFGDTHDRWGVTRSGRHEWGNGQAAPDVSFARQGPGVIGTLPDQCIMSGRGTTDQRPSATAVGAGAQWFDTTIKKPIWSDGASWRDANGTAV